MSNGSRGFTVTVVSMVAQSRTRMKVRDPALRTRSAALAPDTEPFSTWLCLLDLQDVDGLGELARARG